MAVGSILAGGAILAGAGGKGGIKDYKKIVELWNKLKTTNFDFTQLTFPELRMVQEQMPEVYDAIVPPEAKQVAEDPSLRRAQTAGVGYLEQVAREGVPLQDKIQAQTATDAISREQNRSTLSALRALAERGNLGSGDELQARIASGAASSGLSRDLGNQLVQSSLSNRMNAAMALPGAAGAVRGQDFQRSSYNADALNRYNQMVADMRTQAAQYGAGARERAQAYNTGTRQQLATQSQLGRQATSESNLGRKNQLLDRGFSQQLAKLQGLSGAYAQLGAWRDRDRAAKEAAIAGAGAGVDSSLQGILGGLL